MINFWASWCGPCRQEFPALDQIYAKYKPMGFTLVGDQRREREGGRREVPRHDARQLPDPVRPRQQGQRQLRRQRDADHRAGRPPGPRALACTAPTSRATRPSTSSRSARCCGRRREARPASPACCCSAAAACGCSRVEPWVKPYERENLADPIMAWDRDPVSSSYMRHVYESREGARGASGATRRRLRMQLIRGSRARPLAAAAARAPPRVLPDDRADLLYHYYDGGGVTIDGPSLLVRKKFAREVRGQRQLLHGHGLVGLDRRDHDREPVRRGAHAVRRRLRVPARQGHLRGRRSATRARTTTTPTRRTSRSARTCSAT